MTLLKATLAAIPNYILSLYPIPTLVAKKMGSMFKKFIWNDDLEHRRYHLVDWNICCKPICKGGLGIRRIRIHNKVFLAKWL